LPHPAAAGVSTALVGSAIAPRAAEAGLEATETLDPSLPGAATPPYHYGQYIEHRDAASMMASGPRSSATASSSNRWTNPPGRWFARPARRLTPASILSAPLRASLAWRFGACFFGSARWAAGPFHHGADPALKLTAFRKAGVTKLRGGPFNTVTCGSRFCRRKNVSTTRGRRSGQAVPALSTAYR
jgi:hypothetical protein